MVTHILQDAISLGYKQPSTLVKGRAGAAWLLFQEWSFFFCPNLVLLLVGLDFSLFADARKPSRLGQMVAFEDGQ